MDKVAIIQPTHLGDALCSVPLYRALRRGWPGAEIVYAATEASRPFFHRLGAYHDHLLLMDDCGPEQAEFLIDAWRAERLDLVIALEFAPPASFWDGPPPADGGPEPSAVAATLEED